MTETLTDSQIVRDTLMLDAESENSVILQMSAAKINNVGLIQTQKTHTSKERTGAKSQVARQQLNLHWVHVQAKDVKSLLLRR